MAPALFLPFFQLLLLYCTTSAQAQINITIGSSLTPQGVNTSWVSASADFAFGFQAVEKNSSSYLLAIWFNKIADKTIVWYAKTSSNGQDTIPVQVPSGSILKLADGALSLRDPSGNEVWNPRVTDVGYARMLNTGNFRLLGTDGTTKWETFGSPSDTILPTQVLPLGTALHSRLLTTDYSNGRFQLSVQDDGNLVMYPAAVPSGYLYEQYWASNTVGNGSRLVFNETGRIYFTLANGTQINITSAGVDSMGEFFHRATLDTDGVFRQYVYPKSTDTRRLWKEEWRAVDALPQNICQAILTKVGSGACGFNSYCAFDGTKNMTNCLCPQRYKFFDDERKYKGCRPDFEPQSCDLDETAAVLQYEMTPIDRINWPLSDYEQYSPIDETECRRLCATVLLKVPRSTNSPSVLSNGSSKWKKDKNITSRKKTQLSQPSNISGLPPKIFTYSELEKATGGFHEVLGTGASGVVYKGQLQDECGTNIAVKKIEKLQQEAEKEFFVEVQTIGQTFHRNLVRLLGFCNEGTERLLVYEFMSNGSLKTFLFSDTHPHWSLRVQVALGVARGLLYLHEECNKQIIHCDMKPQNILLDDNFAAKISDFGLAKLLQLNQTQTNTGIRGTRGYVAPEWFKKIGITSKVDVYSFGVILLELVCCRKNVELEVTDEEQTILTYWANDCYRCGRIDLLVEGDDEAMFNIKKVERFVAVALWCLQEEPSMRPTMLKDRAFLGML
ncbi:hypothetical protein E2562_004019 [Oryza meyeriana var. granulata]|uniref:non-specific serine/threonine protein kinase n=1 Tax=Oryza meyeriana var. granulata TaxID=110450 RepID=A0A6G1BIM9_9ORYZ|nr:hypothetical protein E2562_004019 [Oryza meyeriana var. granulata]